MTQDVQRGPLTCVWRRKCRVRHLAPPPPACQRLRLLQQMPQTGARTADVDCPGPAAPGLAPRRRRAGFSWGLADIRRPCVLTWCPPVHPCCFSGPKLPFLARATTMLDKAALIASHNPAIYLKAPSPNTVTF